MPFRVLEQKYSYDQSGQHAEDNGSENMIIRGDNLEALKALLPRHEERVKRVIRGYGEGKNAASGTGGNFSFYELGEPLLVGEC